ncbi:hypothetical protein ACNKU7_17385 [Microbulbifer sp. SA54]|uniref:hypothetical protein n=1 Tax=Microbulbifer sp. SA54 TaxID=3401577 RepID=UPI003AB06B76
MKKLQELVRFPRLMVLAFGLQSTATLAYPLSTDEAFCARVQQFIAGTDMTVDNVVYEEDTYWTTFKKSKPQAQPLTTHQYVGYQLANGERADYPVTVACKMKTAERIRTANADSGEITVAEEDRACQTWQALMLDDVYKALEQQGDSALMSRERIALAEENNVYIGPLWLRPELYQVAYTEDDTLKLRSKALHVEYRRFMPVPDSFMGTHYCTMIAPEYLAKLLQGEAEAPPLQE